MNLDIVITGVGGQGSVLTSRVIAQVAMQKGYEVRTSETIGMAQREGSVTSNVRIGKNLQGALIPNHKADILLSFELAETVRGLSKLKPGGIIIANRNKVIPVSVPLGLSSYDEEKIGVALRSKTDQLFLLDASGVAEQAGSSKAVNVVLLGVLATLPGMPFSSEELLAGVLAMVPTKAREINQRAFSEGRKLAEVR